MEKLSQIKEIVSLLEKDTLKHEKGVKVAKKRIITHLNKLRLISKEFRKEMG